LFAAPSNPLDAEAAARSILPMMARPLQKYLRAARQGPRHTADSVLAHLTLCLKHGASAKAFLERYLKAAPVLQDDRERKAGRQNWSLISEKLLTRGLAEGVVFQLRQESRDGSGDVSLICTVAEMPHFDIREEVINEATNR